MFQVVGSQQQRRDLVATEDDRECLGLFGIGDKVDHPRTAQGGLVEKAEGTHGLDKDALRGLLVEEVERIRTGQPALRGYLEVAAVLLELAARVPSVVQTFAIRPKSQSFASRTASSSSN